MWLADDGEDHAVGRALGGQIGRGQGLESRAVAPVDDHRAAVAAGRWEEVGGGCALVGVGEGAEQDGARRDSLDARDRRPLELVSWASSTVRRAGGVSGVTTPPMVVTMMLRVNVPARLLGVRVAAE